MDHSVGAFCAVLCCDILSGICFDFTTTRQRCTETLCRCCWNTEGQLGDPDEQQPLNPETSDQPSSHAPMRCTS
ncbi:hypothetical protein BKA82DRAFT_1002194 [Pisolithus tinctorius]|uniref:Secreted protein n=1 Tax=Pisolithus tinctorius Marx 270 TaxID=870435 RepID=A0A0C3NNW9_PISTI|nr:hypothetical protein BKA82DRAFT_1002194 [Pisolithus tinctorius]KIO02585.1 hypothetical protein M404DRAFT_1002194 [Pisolithus tinctorius Marx 270]